MRQKLEKKMGTQLHGESGIVVTVQCACVSAKTFSHKLVAFLLQKLEQSSRDEKVRIAALSIVRHLVNAAGTFRKLFLL